MYKDDYISAFGKLAPSEEWMTDIYLTNQYHNIISIFWKYHLQYW